MSRVLFKEYRRLFTLGRKIYNKYYLIYYVDHPITVIRTSAKKKLGTAVKRNYEKRIVRRIITKLHFKKPIFLMVICLKPCDFSYTEKQDLLSKLLRSLA